MTKKPDKREKEIWLVEIDQNDLQEAIRNYLKKKGYIMTGEADVFPNQTAEAHGWKINS